jgi:hypothetical protein
MKIEMIRMSTCPHSYFHIELLTKLEPVYGFRVLLLYGLHPLLPIKYLLPSKPGENRDPQPIKVLISRLFELEKL